MLFNKILTVILLAIFAYLSIRYLMSHFLELCLFHPGKVEAYTVSNVTEVKIKSLDKKDDIYVLQTKTDKSKTHIIYSHGNAGNMNMHGSLFNILGRHSSITMYDYKGYGKSTGKSSEQSLKDDITAVYEYVTKVDRTDNKDIILYGRSLGVYPTLFLAKMLSDNGIRVKHVIIEAGFSSTSGVAKKIIGDTLTKILFAKKFRNTELIKDITSPILLAHSVTDEIVSYDNATALLDKNKNIDHYVLKVQHNDETLKGDYLTKILDIINK